MKHTKKRVAALLLTLAMVLSLMPAAFAADTDFPDMPAEEDASYAAVKSAVDNEIMTGENGMLNLEGTILRSTVSKMVVTAFAAKGEADLSDYADVADGAWYEEWMAKAAQMGIMSGSSGKMRPNDEVTLQEVAAMLVRALGLELGDETDLEGVPGGDSVAPWAIPWVAALVKAGYISDVTGATEPMTRGAFAEVIYHVTGEGNYVKEAGAITEDVDGNIVITADGVSLEGITVKGDVIIADGVDAGSIVLDNVKIEGRLVVRGGETAELKNGTTASATVVAKSSGEITVKADDSSDAGKIDVTGTQSKAPEKVTLDMAEPNATISTDTAVAVQNAKGGEVTMAAANVSLTVESGKLDNVVVSDGMNEAKVEVAEGATIGNITTNTDLTVTGEGTVSAVTGSGVVSDESGEVIGGGDDEPADVPTVTGSTLPTPEELPDELKPTAHTHIWSDPEQFDATRHALVCDYEEGENDADENDEGCGATTYAAHSFTVGYKADGTTAGDDDTVAYYKCACGATQAGSVTSSTEPSAATNERTKCGEDGAEHEDHKWVAKAKDGDCAATCQAVGKKSYECEYCGSTKTDTIAQLEHSYKATTTTAASCDEDGAIVYECTTCESGTGHDKTVVIPATGNHTWKLKTTVAATCQAAGKYVYECTSCTGETAATQEVTIAKDASAHDWSGAWTVGEGENAGKCVKTCAVENCTEKKTQTHVKQNYTGSDTDKAYKAPTCQAVGHTAAVVCRDCGAVITAAQEIPKTSHTAAATLASDANQHWTVCKDCEAEMSEKTAHSWDKTDADGNALDGAQCTVCGYKKTGSSSGGQTEPQHGAAEAWEKDDTNHWHACKIEGCTDESHVYNKAGHIYAENAQKGDACTVCGGGSAPEPVQQGSD